MSYMSTIINMSNIHSLQSQFNKHTYLVSNTTHDLNNCICFRIPKPIPSTTQPGARKKCSQYIQTTLGPYAHRNTKKSFIKIDVNHFNSFEGAPHGFGSAPKNNII